MMIPAAVRISSSLFKNQQASPFGDPSISSGHHLGLCFCYDFHTLESLGWTMGLKVADEEEETGLDLSQPGETGYNF